MFHNLYPLKDDEWNQIKKYFMYKKKYFRESYKRYVFLFSVIISWELMTMTMENDSSGKAKIR